MTPADMMQALRSATVVTKDWASAKSDIEKIDNEHPQYAELLLQASESCKDGKALGPLLSALHESQNPNTKEEVLKHPGITAAASNLSLLLQAHVVASAGEKTVTPDDAMLAFTRAMSAMRVSREMQRPPVDRYAAQSEEHFEDLKRYREGDIARGAADDMKRAVEEIGKKYPPYAQLLVNGSEALQEQWVLNCILQPLLKSPYPEVRRDVLKHPGTALRDMTMLDQAEVLHDGLREVTPADARDAFMRATPIPYAIGGHGGGGYFDHRGDWKKASEDVRTIGEEYPAYARLLLQGTETINNNPRTGEFARLDCLVPPLLLQSPHLDIREMACKHPYVTGKVDDDHFPGNPGVDTVKERTMQISGSQFIEQVLSNPFSDVQKNILPMVYEHLSYEKWRDITNDSREGIQETLLGFANMDSAKTTHTPHAEDTLSLRSEILFKLASSNHASIQRGVAQSLCPEDALDLTKEARSPDPQYRNQSIILYMLERLSASTDARTREELQSKRNDPRYNGLFVENKPTLHVVRRTGENTEQLEKPDAGAPSMSRPPTQYQLDSLAGARQHSSTTSITPSTSTPKRSFLKRFIPGGRKNDDRGLRPAR